MSTHDGPWADGTPCWNDLSVSDLKAGWALYSAALGWEIVDQGEDSGHYGIAMTGGRAAAAVGPKMMPDQPTGWTTYLATSDVDKAAEAVTAAGGTVMVPPGDVGPAGRMAIAADPTGGVFGLWQAGDMPGFGVANEPGAVGWNDLHSTDPVRAREFYTAVFGYSYTQMEGGQDYWTINGAGPGNTVGAIGAADPALPAGTPSVWMPYFVVADAEAAVAEFTGRGGELISGPMDTPFGRMARVRDPEGALLTIMGVPAPEEAAANA
jgi:uncharacterized protein